MAKLSGLFKKEGPEKKNEAVPMATGPSNSSSEGSYNFNYGDGTDSRSVYTTGQDTTYTRGGTSSIGGASDFQDFRPTGVLGTIYTTYGELQPSSDLTVVHDSLVKADWGDEYDAARYTRQLRDQARNRNRLRPLAQQRANDKFLRQIDEQIGEAEYAAQVYEQKRKWASEAARGGGNYVELKLPPEAANEVLAGNKGPQKYFSIYDQNLRLIQKQNRIREKEEEDRKKMRWKVSDLPNGDIMAVTAQGIPLEQLQRAKKEAWERMEQQRLEQQRLEQQRLEQQRLEQQRLEQQRLEQQRLEQQRLEQQQLEQQRLEQERLEQESYLPAPYSERQQITSGSASSLNPSTAYGLNSYNNSASSLSSGYGSAVSAGGYMSSNSSSSSKNGPPNTSMPSLGSSEYYQNAATSSSLTSFGGSASESPRSARSVGVSDSPRSLRSDNSSSTSLHTAHTSAHDALYFTSQQPTLASLVALDQQQQLGENDPPIEDAMALPLPNPAYATGSRPKSGSSRSSSKSRSKPGPRSGSRSRSRSRSRTRAQSDSSLMESPHTGMHRRYVSSASSTFYPLSMYREVIGTENVLPDGEEFPGDAASESVNTVTTSGPESFISESTVPVQSAEPELVQPSFRYAAAAEEDSAEESSSPLSAAARDEVVTNLEDQANAFSTTTKTTADQLLVPDPLFNQPNSTAEPEAAVFETPSSKSSGKMSGNEVSHFSAKALRDRYNKINSNKHKKPKSEAVKQALPPAPSAVNAIAATEPAATQGAAAQAEGTLATAGTHNPNHSNGYPFKKPLTSFGKVLVAPVNLLMNGTTSAHPPPNNIRIVDSQHPQSQAAQQRQMEASGPHPNNPNHYVQPPLYDLPAVRPQFAPMQYPDGTGNHMEIPIVPMDYTDDDKLLGDLKPAAPPEPIVSTPVQQIKTKEHHEIAPIVAAVAAPTKASIKSAPKDSSTKLPMDVAAKPKKVALHGPKGVRVVAPDASLSSPQPSQTRRHSNVEGEVLEYAPMMPAVSSGRRRARAPTEKSMSLYSRRGELVVEVPYSKVRNGVLSDPVGVPVAKGDWVPEPPVHGFDVGPAKPPKVPLEQQARSAEKKEESTGHPQAKKEAMESEENTGRMLYNSWLSKRAAIEGWATETVGGITATLRPTLPSSQVLTAKQAAEMSAARYLRANPDLRAIETAANSHKAASSIYSGSTTSSATGSSYSTESESIMSSPSQSTRSRTTGVSQATRPASSAHTATTVPGAIGTPASSQIKVRIPIANVPLRVIDPTQYTRQGDVDMEMVDRSRIGSPVPGFAGPGGTFGPGPRTPGVLEAAALKAQRSPAFSKIKQMFSGGAKMSPGASKAGTTVGNTPRTVPRSMASPSVIMSKQATPKQKPVYGFGVNTEEAGSGEMPAAFGGASGPVLRGVFTAIRRIAQLSVILRPIDNVADTVPMLYPTVIVLEVLALLWLLHQVSMILEVILAVTRTVSAPVAGLSHILTAGLGGAAKASVEEIVEGAGGHNHVL